MNKRIFDPLKNVARTRKHYVAAWSSHINELIHVHCDADIPIEDWEATRQSLLAVVVQAADKLHFEKGD